jgi:DNA-binding beta-propeller fold protein YncE
MSRPAFRSITFSCAVFLLVLVLTGCNFPGASTAAPEPTEPPLPGPTEIIETPVPVVLDLCTLLTDEEVQEAVGAAVESSSDMGVANCTYTTVGGDVSLSVNVSAAQGIEAKTLNMVGVQLILLFAGDPSALESLNELNENAESMSVWEVVLATIQFQEDLGAEVSSVEELGAQARWIWNPGGYGTLMIVDDQTYLSFTMIGFEPEAGRQTAIDLEPLAKERLPVAFTVSTSGEFGGGFQFEMSDEEPTAEPTLPQPTPTPSGPPAVWVTNNTGGTISHIDPATNQVVNTIWLKKGLVDIVASHDYLFVANSDESSVVWIDPVTESVHMELPIDIGTHLKLDIDPSYLYVTGPRWGQLQIRDRTTGDLIEEFVYANCWDVAASEYGIWFPTGGEQESVVHLDPATRREVSQFTPGGGGVSYVKFYEGYYWLGIHGEPHKVLKVDPQTYELVAEFSVETSQYMSAMGVGESAVWVGFSEGMLIKIDPQSGQELQRVNITTNPVGIAAGYGSVWTTHIADHVVTRLDSETLQLITTIPVGQNPFGIALRH